MSRRSDQRDQLERIEVTLVRIKGWLAKLENALDVSTPGGLSSVASDAKGARSSAEAAFAGTQAVASHAMAKPGREEIAAAIGDVEAQVRSVAALVAPKPAKVDMPAPPATPMKPVAGPAGSAGTDRGKGATGG